MTASDRAVARAQAEDTQNLLDHIAWTDVIKPSLEKLQAIKQRQLVETALGHPVLIQSAAGPTKLSIEQIGGEIAGIMYIQTLIERILAKGQKALTEDLALHSLASE